MIILGIIFSIVTIFLLKYLHIEVFAWGWSDEYRRFISEKIDEYDFKLKIWHVLIIILIGLIPLFNIAAFSIFIVYYTIHSLWGPNDCGTIHVFTNKYVTKLFKPISLLISKVSKFLNREI